MATIEFLQYVFLQDTTVKEEAMEKKVVRDIIRVLAAQGYNVSLFEVGESYGVCIENNTNILDITMSMRELKQALENLLQETYNKLDEIEMTVCYCCGNGDHDMELTDGYCEHCLSSRICNAGKCICEFNQNRIWVSKQDWKNSAEY